MMSPELNEGDLPVALSNRNAHEATNLAAYILSEVEDVTAAHKAVSAYFKLKSIQMNHLRFMTDRRPDWLILSNKLFNAAGRIRLI